MKKVTPLRKAAIHECGHALLYHLLGKDLEYLFAKPDGSGFCKAVSRLPIAFKNNDDSILYQELFNYGLICFAGYTAEAMLMFGNLDFEKAYTAGSPTEGEYPDNDFGNFREQIDAMNRVVGNGLYNFEFFQTVSDAIFELMMQRPMLEGLFALYEVLLKTKGNLLQGMSAHQILDNHILKGTGHQLYKKSE